MILKDVCALLAATSLGAGAVVTVPAVHKPTRDKIASAAGYQPRKPVRSASVRPRMHQTVAPSAPPTASSAAITDCAIPGAGIAPSILPNLVEAPAGQFGSGMQPLHPHPDDNPVFGPGNPAIADFPITNPVPEADSWLMFIAGFGLLGMSIRRRKRPGTQSA